MLRYCRPLHLHRRASFLKLRDVRRGRRLSSSYAPTIFIAPPRAVATVPYPKSRDDVMIPPIEALYAYPKYISTPDESRLIGGHHVPFSTSTSAGMNPSPSSAPAAGQREEEAEEVADESDVSRKACSDGSGDAETASFSPREVESALSLSQFADMYRAMECMGICVSSKEDGTSFSLSDVKEAYRELVKRLHPDVEGGDGEMMESVNTAYQLLREVTPLQRAAYLFWLRKNDGYQKMKQMDIQEWCVMNGRSMTHEEVAEIAVRGMCITVLGFSVWWGLLHGTWNSHHSTDALLPPPQPWWRSTRASKALWGSVDGVSKRCRSLCALSERAYAVASAALGRSMEQYIQRVFFHGRFGADSAPPPYATRR